MIFLFTILTFLSTLAGGLFAFRHKDKPGLISGFSAGAVIGVSFFDLLPESFSLGNGYFTPGFITALAALGFFFYMIMDRLTLLHFHSEGIQTNNRGNLGAGSLSMHSFFDGVAIGLAFQTSNSVGISVAMAVIVHNFSDGLNTISVVMKNNNRNRRRHPFRWLLADSIAPVLGITSTFFFTLSDDMFAIVLSIFSGFFFYIGASDLLPESQHKYPSIWTTCMTILAAAVIYAVSKLGIMSYN